MNSTATAPQVGAGGTAAWRRPASLVLLALSKLHKSNALGVAYGQLFSLANLPNVLAEST